MKNIILTFLFNNCNNFIFCITIKTIVILRNTLYLKFILYEIIRQLRQGVLLRKNPNEVGQNVCPQGSILIYKIYTSPDPTLYIPNKLSVYLLVISEKGQGRCRNQISWHPAYSRDPWSNNSGTACMHDIIDFRVSSQIIVFFRNNS